MPLPEVWRSITTVIVFGVSSYYLAILFATMANLALAAVALVQRAKQIRGNKLRERQVQLAETRNDLAEERLRSLQDQIVILSEIRDALCTPNSPAKGREQGSLDGNDHNGFETFLNAGNGSRTTRI